MDAEIWKPVVGYEGIYEVSSQGRVRRILAGPGTRAGRILTPFEGQKGYKQVTLLRKTVCLHRILAMAFLGPSDLPLVRHLDGNPANNSLENLAWGTHQDNTDDRVLHGRTTNYGHSATSTHCKWGHEYTPENTRYRAPRNGGNPTRRCRECTRLESHSRYVRRTAQ